MAVAPQPLTVSPISLTIDDLRAEANMIESAPSSTSRLGFSLEGWYFIFDMDDPASRYIQPQRRKAIVNADGSGVSRIFAGTSVDADGSTIDPLPRGAAEPGTTLQEIEWGEGEMFGGFPAPPPETPKAMRVYLDAHLRLSGLSTEHFSAADYAQAAVTLLQTWTLSPAAEKSLIAAVLNGDGAVVRGSTTERAGRDGLLIELGRGADQQDGVSEQLVIDTTSWRILAAETISTGGDPGAHLLPGSVISYTLWR